MLAKRKAAIRRTFTWWQKYSYALTLLVAFGGLWLPSLGLLVILVMASLTIMSLFRGRYWCGNFCSHGSLFEQLIAPLSRQRDIPRPLQGTVVRVLVFLFFMASFSRRLMIVLPSFGSMGWTDQLGFVFVTTYLAVTVAGSILGMMFSPRTWCQICPMGMMQNLAHPVGRLLGTTAGDVRITLMEPDKCTGCKQCTRACPMQLYPYTNMGNDCSFDHDGCIKCSACVENCPLRLLELQTPPVLADKPDKTAAAN